MSTRRPRRDFGEAPRKRTPNRGELRRTPRQQRPSGGGAGRSLAWIILLGALAIGIAVVVLGGGGDDETAQPATTATVPAGVVRFLIPEGFRREDIAARLEEKTDLAAAEYLELTKPGARGRALAKAAKATSLEGFLFPATYEIGPITTVADLVDQQIAAYERETADVNYAKARAGNLTKFEVLTIASMIEREVQVADERPIVASVIYNRLRAGMSLGIDATVQYAIGEWRALTAADLEVDSKYNTRKEVGLPPGPICSPGKASIAAAAAPADTDFLYYVAKDDGSGEHYFAKTLAEHDALVARARQNRGG